MHNRDRFDEQGYIDVPGGRVWYGVTGRAPGIPLLVLHGGPGTPHDYLRVLDGLGGERRVVFFDQLGCGRSDRPDNPELWRLPRFLKEMHAVIRYLGLRKMHLLGHSWGTTLAAAYVLEGFGGVASIVFLSPCLSIPRLIRDIAVLKSQLPEEIVEILARHESAGTMDSVEYKVASMAFFERHICRIYPFPKQLQKAFETRGEQVYRHMWGEVELSITGNLKDFDCTDRLGELSMPTLLLCGREDECTPQTTARFHEQLPDSEMAVFEDSSHFISVEEPERFLATVGDFLRRVEARTQPSEGESGHAKKGRGRARERVFGEAPF